MTDTFNGVELRGSTILILGGAGLVGEAVARALLPHEPARLVLAALTREEAEEAVAELRAEVRGETSVEPRWGDLFVPHELKDRPRGEILGDPRARALLVDDLYGELTEEVFQRSALGRLLLEVDRKSVV